MLHLGIQSYMFEPALLKETKEQLRNSQFVRDWK